MATKKLIRIVSHEERKDSRKEGRDILMQLREAGWSLSHIVTIGGSKAKHGTPSYLFTKKSEIK